MKLNMFRFFGGVIGGAVWFLAAALLQHPARYAFVIAGVAAILLGINEAWVRDERQGRDPME